MIHPTIFVLLILALASWSIPRFLEWCRLEPSILFPLPSRREVRSDAWISLISLGGSIFLFELRPVISEILFWLSFGIVIGGAIIPPPRDHSLAETLLGKLLEVAWSGKISGLFQAALVAAITFIGTITGDTTMRTPVLALMAAAMIVSTFKTLALWGALTETGSRDGDRAGFGLAKVLTLKGILSFVGVAIVYGPPGMTMETQGDPLGPWVAALSVAVGHAVQAMRRQPKKPMT